MAIAGWNIPCRNWQQLKMETTPGWLNSLQLKRFSASRNLIIDIEFDFWHTALDGYGANPTLVTDRQWGVCRESEAATFNRVDVARRWRWDRCQQAGEYQRTECIY